MDQIAHDFVIGVGNPDRGQFSGAMETDEHGGVTTICLHPIARLHWDQRRCHHVAPMPEADEMTMNAIAARIRFITKRRKRCGRATPIGCGRRGLGS
ncbi:hypothetical protein A1351_21915 [Methylosinus sp. R-45379]|nr:hypothetical protein A1351_21915 [Methylosinus sp. R-45379]